MSRLYLYGFVPSGAPLPETGLLGVADGLVELLDEPAGEFAAVVSPVPEDDFSEARLEERTGDLEWMAEQGLRHEQVVGWFVDHATILPSRLLTLFSGREAVEAAGRRDADRIHAALDRMRGVREWDLKVGYHPSRLEARLAEVSEAIAALDREIEAATPGKRFLLNRKRQDLARTEGRAAARRLAAELLEELEPLALESRRVGPGAEDAPVLLNTALLVPRAAEADLVERARAARDRLERLGVEVQLTGPWAPYRFLDRDDD